MSKQPFDWNSYEQEFHHYAALYKEKSIVPDAFRILTAGKAAMDGLKTLAQYADEVKDIQKRGEFMKIIGDLKVELAQTQMKLAEQLQENIDLKQEIDTLKKEVEKLRNPDSKPVLKEGLYFVNDTPICIACYEVIPKSIPLTQVGIVFEGWRKIKYECPHCHTKYFMNL